MGRPPVGSNSPFGENEGELFVSTEKTEAGKEADCAHKYPPPPGSATYGADYRACLASEPNWQDVSGKYSFFLPAPPSPGPGARMVFRSIDEGSSNAPAPTLTPAAGGVNITFALKSRPAQSLKMAYRVFVGWSPVPPDFAADPPARHFRQPERPSRHGSRLHGRRAVRRQLESTRPNQATTAPGDWNLYWDLNGIWGKWAPGNGEFLTNDGQTFSNGQTIDLYVPQGKGWRLFVHGRECDLNGLDPANPMADCPTNRELADNNDVQGEIVDSYRSAAASLGRHTSNAATASNDPTSTCPNANSAGCYSLTYTVKAVDDAASRAATFASRSG
jgi:hypothetical protein